jgi:Sec-independent protein translocase protein TatA
LDTVCGIGLPELIILALVGFVLIGPERSQDVALRAGRFIRTVMRSSWWSDFNQVADAIRDLPNTLVRMAEQEEELQSLKREIQEIGTEVNSEISKATAGPEREPRSGETTDPWGIRNASAQTTIRPPHIPESRTLEAPQTPENDHADSL